VGKQLVITEKPSVARDIADALGGFVENKEYLENDDYVVTWAVGHLVKLADPKDYKKEWSSWAIKHLPLLPDHWDLKPRTGQKTRLNQIKKLGNRKDVDGLINACDAGREGELIYRRIVEYTGLDAKPQQRLWLRSMTKSAIIDAFDALRPGHELDNLGDAAFLRSVGDWLIGLNASRALSQRLRSRTEGTWSAGRVQTPTLALLVGREREILAHRPRPYWELTATFSHGEGEAAQTWEGKWWDPSRKGPTRDEKATRLFDRAEVDALMAGLKASDQGAADEKRKASKQNPPLLFDLTSLQREANRRFSMSAKRTLQAAQRLYEGHKLTTYPRTDARHLPDDYGPVVDEVIEWATGLSGVEGMDDVSGVASGVKAAGPKNLKKLLDSDKVSDHFAIIPTGNPVEQVLEGDDLRVFSLIVRQFLAALMGPATWATVERIVTIDLGDAQPRFRTTARSLEIPGFLEALGQEKGKGTRLPALTPGNDKVTGVVVGLDGVEEEAKETRPPPRYSEAQMLRMMETAGERVADDDLSDAMKGRGLGTPATRADTIENLIRKEYARRVEGKIGPTSKAMRLIDILERVDAAFLASPKLTGEWEYMLSEVEKGERKRADVEQGLIDSTKDLTSKLVGFDHRTLWDGEEPVGICPSCGGKVGESHWGYPCENNKGRDDGCDFIIWKDRMGRYVDRELASQLIEHKGERVGPLDGFVALAGRRYLTGTLSLQPDLEHGWVVKVEFGDAPEEEEEEEVVVGKAFPCPCGQGEGDDAEHYVLETNQRWVCELKKNGKTKKAPVLPKRVCKREMKPDEAAQYFSEEGQTQILEDFTSRRGRPFKGKLIRQASGRHKFEFPPRGKKKGAKGKGSSKKKSTSSKKTATSSKKKSTSSKKKSTSSKKKSTASKKKSTSSKKKGGSRRSSKAAEEEVVSMKPTKARARSKRSAGARAVATRAAKKAKANLDDNS